MCTVCMWKSHGVKAEPAARTAPQNRPRTWDEEEEEMEGALFDERSTSGASSDRPKVPERAYDNPGDIDPTEDPTANQGLARRRRNYDDGL